ncbi:MAG: EpsI family protein [Bdellovibrionales bacterium]|nr:EpsI family protein [Bdellovibrionales bacterium]
MKIAQSISRYGAIIALMILASMALGAARIESARSGVATSDLLLGDLPYQLGEWTGRDLPGVGIRSQEILQLDRYLRRAYERPDGSSVAVYIGYWRKQSGDYQAAKHSPAVCLPANGWTVISSRTRTLPTSTGTLTVNTLIAKTGPKESLYVYWFFRGNESYHQEWKALAKIGVGAFLHGESDGGLVEISLPLAGTSPAAVAAAESVALDFIDQLVPALASLRSKNEPQTSLTQPPS